MSEGEIHTLSRLLMERTGLVAAGSMAVRAEIELMLQKGYRIIPPAPRLIKPDISHFQHGRTARGCGAGLVRFPWRAGPNLLVRLLQDEKAFIHTTARDGQIFKGERDELSTQWHRSRTEH